MDNRATNGSANRILVISLQGIGDAILITPLLSSLKRNIKDAEVSVLTFRSNRGVLAGNKDLDELICVDRNDVNNPLRMVRLIYGLRKKKFGTSICTYPSGLRTALLSYLSGAKKKFGQELSILKKYRWLFTKLVPVNEIKHAVLMNMDFMRLFGVEPDTKNAAVSLNVCGDDERYADKFLKSQGVEEADRIVAVHPGCGKNTSQYRRWPLERFIEVINCLGGKNGLKVILIGGMDDLPALNGISDKLKIKPVIAAGKLSIMQTAALLGRSSFLICNNSAPMHIAAAVGTPTISIFGPTDPRIHRPWGGSHAVLQKHHECCPCYYPFIGNTLEGTGVRNSWSGKHFYCKSKDYRCLTSVTVEDVINASDKLLNYRKSTNG
ncbi:MAG: glycosyltransferase family 9 protein [Syntrophorhabdaceae bacterium]|jgi:ADP-heptose:LPS heptosyltransferase|nr:glycosyltransferase family 9 protein [Syntrophorhabdaceae bacterium]